MRTETRIFSKSFVANTVASFLDRRINGNHSEAVAIIEDLHQHHVLDKLTKVIPILSTDVLLAFSKAPAFQDLLIAASPPTNTPVIFKTQGDAFFTLLSALPRAKTRLLFLATTPERVAQALSTLCHSQGEAFDLAISLDLGNEHEDAVISTLASTSFRDDAVNLPPDATVTNMTNAVEVPSIPASAQSSGTASNAETGHQPSASTSNSTNAPRLVAAAASSTLTAKTAAPAEQTPSGPPEQLVLNPTLAPNSTNPTAKAPTTRRTGANVDKNLNPTVLSNPGPAVASVGDSGLPRPPPVNPRPAPAAVPPKALPTATALKPRPTPAAALPKALPTATALKTHLLGRSTVNPQDAPQPAKGKSGKQSRKGAPQPSDDDSDGDSSVELSSSGSSGEDYKGSDSTDDDAPLAVPRESKAEKGKSAAAAQRVSTPDEDESDPDEAIYGETEFLTTYIERNIRDICGPSTHMFRIWGGRVR